MLIVIVILCSMFCGTVSAQRQGQGKIGNHRAVVPLLSGGRFGDNILAVAHALSFSMEHNIPLLIPEFPYSQELALDDLVGKYFPAVHQFKHSTVYTKELPKYLVVGAQDVLFQIPYFPESAIEYTVPNRAWKPLFPVMWNDQKFKARLRQLIAPKHPLQLLRLPKDKVCVAVHLRRGGGFDNNLEVGIMIYKFPRDAYFINAIKKVHELAKYAPLYVYLFTDDPDPAYFLELYKEMLDDDRIELAARINDNNHFSNVLEDFFSMIQPDFQYLIRPESNFSVMAEKMGYYRAVITPALLVGDSKVHGIVVNMKEHAR